MYTRLAREPVWILNPDKVAFSRSNHIWSYEPIFYLLIWHFRPRNWVGRLLSWHIFMTWTLKSILTTRRRKCAERWHQSTRIAPNALIKCVQKTLSAVELSSVLSTWFKRSRRPSIETFRRIHANSLWHISTISETSRYLRKRPLIDSTLMNVTDSA